MTDYFVHPGALCETVQVGPRTRIWAFVHILPGARIGADCNICDGVFVENDVVLGDRVTIKSGVQLWDGVRLGDDVFVGPNATFANDKFPRSRAYQDSVPQTIVEQGASLGANCTILPGVRIGRHAMIGAGTVVTADVPPFAIVMGNPSRITGYVDSAGRAMPPARPVTPPSHDEVVPVVPGVTLHRLGGALFVVPAIDFGQRDHVALVLLLPALVWQAGRRRGAPVTAAGWAMVTAAALGVLIKPYLVLAVAGAYAIRLAEERDWRLLIEPPVWCFAFIACLYAGVILVVFPEWFQVARIAQSAYSAYDASEWISRRTVVAAVAIAALAVANEMFGRQGERRLGRVLAAAAAGALGSYVLQHKGIEYHFIPTRTLVWLLIGLVVLEGVRWAAALPLPAVLRRWLAMASRYRVVLLCLIAVLPFYRLVDRTALDERRVDESMRAMAAVLDAKRIGPRIAVFGTSVYPAYPLSLYRETLPAWRFAQPWMIPWILQQGRAGRADAPDTVKMSAEMRGLVIEDFERYRPDAILVDETPEKLFLPNDFDIMAWFRQDPRMAAILDKFERVAVFDDPNERIHFRRMAVYRRI